MRGLETGLWGATVATQAWIERCSQAQECGTSWEEVTVNVRSVPGELTTNWYYSRSSTVDRSNCAGI